MASTPQALPAGNCYYDSGISLQTGEKNISPDF